MVFSFFFFRGLRFGGVGLEGFGVLGCRTSGFSGFRLGVFGFFRDVRVPGV